VEFIETLTPAKAKEMEELKADNERLQEQSEKAAIEAGLPPNVATERRIAHCDFHIFDLLRLAGKGFIVEGKDFEHCTIRAPALSVLTKMCGRQNRSPRTLLLGAHTSRVP
jgi:hypothetical protein